MINPTAIIAPSVELGKNVSVGAYSIINGDVEIGDNCWIGPHVVINGPSKIGKDNRIYQFCSIGEDPQDKKYTNNESSTLEIGDKNLIREYCSINRGTLLGGGKTTLGSHNWIMAYAHIAHDCIVGDNTVFANHATLAGHVRIENYVTLGGFTGVHQYCSIGQYCFSAIASVITRDIPPYLMVFGNTASPKGLNKEGLKRHGFSTETIETLERAYKIVYRNKLTKNHALEALQDMATDSKEVAHFSDFISRSKRGIAR